MVGRESTLANNVFFVCSLIDYIARKTKNKRADVVNKLGLKRIAHLLEFADVYHSDNIDAVSDKLIEEAAIVDGGFDNVSAARYALPSYWDIGKVYKRLVLNIMEDEQVDAPQAISNAYNSFVSPLVDDYNGSFYYESPQAIFAAYKYHELD